MKGFSEAKSCKKRSLVYSTNVKTEELDVLLNLLKYDYENHMLEPVMTKNKQIDKPSNHLIRSRRFNISRTFLDKDIKNIQTQEQNDVYKKSFFQNQQKHIKNQNLSPSMDKGAKIVPLY